MKYVYFGPCTEYLEMDEMRSYLKLAAAVNLEQVTLTTSGSGFLDIVYSYGRRKGIYGESQADIYAF